jgi:uncharacterized protein YraI
LEAVPAPSPCTVIAGAIYLRSGPGTAYAPIGNLANGAEFDPQARNEATTWLWGTVRQSGEIGWVTARPQYLACPGVLADLPVSR